MKLTKTHKKIWTVIVIIASLALVISSFLPLLSAL